MISSISPARPAPLQLRCYLERRNPPLGLRAVVFTLCSGRSALLVPPVIYEGDIPGQMVFTRIFSLKPLSDRTYE